VQHYGVSGLFGFPRSNPFSFWNKLPGHVDLRLIGMEGTWRLEIVHSAFCILCTALW